MKVAHLTSVHAWDDIRIFHKQCTSLAQAGHEVVLIAAGAKEQELNGVKVISVPKANRRWKRMRQTVNTVCNKAIAADADIYHLHDPELLRIANKFIKLGKKVIYDAHENLPEALLSRPYLSPWLRKTVAAKMGKYELKQASKITAIVAATPQIERRFSSVNNSTVTINNYPLLGEVESIISGTEKLNEICYAGGITQIRGIENMVIAIGKIDDVKLNLAGPYESNQFKAKLQQVSGWSKVIDLGSLSREDLQKVYAKCFAGMVLFLPYPNHINAQPNKLFEYMGAGLPVIGSNFPLWKEIIEGNNCGVCVNPESPDEIAEAIKHLFNNKKLAMELGANGKKAVQEKFNWGIEEQKLLELYEQLA